ncbi:MAG: hypothetical protein ABFE08_16295 [Armatimonadia bacterium]
MPNRPSEGEPSTARAVPVQGLEACPDRRRAVAYHEAGHAVMDCLRGRSFRWVSIVRTDAYAGQVQGYDLPKWFEPDMASGPEYDEVIETLVLGLLAGGVVEEEYIGIRPEPWSVQSDLEKAVTLAECLSGSIEDTENYLDEMRERARTLLREHWTAVETLATALLQRPKMNGSAACQIIEAALPAAAKEEAARRRRVWGRIAQRMGKDRAIEERSQRARRHSALENELLKVLNEHLRDHPMERDDVLAVLWHMGGRVREAYRSA